MGQFLPTIIFFKLLKMTVNLNNKLIWFHLFLDIREFLSEMGLESNY